MKAAYSLMILLAAMLLISNQSNAQVNKNDSLALVDLFNYTNGNQWINKSGWLQGPVSSWYGITLQNNRVWFVDLNNNNLTGALPSSIKNLTALAYLELYQNHIGGVIPSSIGSITTLMDIALFENELTGIIPSSIGKMPNLSSLSLSNNHLTGKIPSSLGSNGKLNFLVLGYNDLTGTIPLALGNCNIIQLTLSHNQLTGPIPDTLKNSNFNELDLDYNQLSGNIPEWIGNSSRLENLWLNNNKFTGQIPLTIGGYSNRNPMGGISLSNNQLSGPVPENLGDIHIISLLSLENNFFNFDGIEYLNSYHGNIIYKFTYAPQYPIKLHSTNYGTPNVFSVSAGGTLSNNTYKWYKDGVLAATKVGDSTYSTTDSGRYSVQVTNSIATDLTLQSDTVFYNPAIKITVNNMTVAEGGTGTTTPATFSVKLNKAAPVSVKVSYTTKDGSAIAGEDYVAKSGTLTFKPGQITKRVSVTVNGDGTVESNERFYLQLSNAVNAVTAAKDSAICTVTNDDAGLIAGAALLPATTIQLSPNPVRAIVQVNGLPAGVQSVFVVNASGAVLLEQAANTNKLSIDVKRLTAGNYYLLVKSAAGTMSLPFVKL